MSRSNRNYNNQKGGQQSRNGPSKTSATASGRPASGKIVYDEHFPPLSTASTVPIADNPPLPIQVNIHHLFSDEFNCFNF
jgi:hypothetical protein